jgi:hypothetical protein
MSRRNLEHLQRARRALQHPRVVITDIHARYFGIELNDQSLTPGDNPLIGPTRFEDWLSQFKGNGGIGRGA